MPRKRCSTPARSPTSGRRPRGRTCRCDAGARCAAGRDRRRAVPRRARARGRAEVRRALALDRPRARSPRSSSSPTSPPTGSSTSAGRASSAARIGSSTATCARQRSCSSWSRSTSSSSSVSSTTPRITSTCSSMLNRVTRLGGSMLLESTVDRQKRRDRPPELARVHRQGEGRADCLGAADGARVDGLAERAAVHRLPSRFGTRCCCSARRPTSSPIRTGLAPVVTAHRREAP